MDEQIKWLYEFARLDPDFSKYFPCPPFDPSKSYEEIETNPYLKSLMRFCVDNGSVKLIYDDVRQLEEKIRSGILELRIDFNKINTIQGLKRKMDRTINLYFGKFKKRHGYSVTKSTKNFKLIYLVGTLRNKKQTWGDIVNHPEFPLCADPKRAAKTLYEYYKHLVQGGWKNYLK